jgi:hypothetical protein
MACHFGLMVMSYAMARPKIGTTRNQGHTTTVMLAPCSAEEVRTGCSNLLREFLREARHHYETFFRFCPQKSGKK